MKDSKFLRFLLVLLAMLLALSGCGLSEGGLSVKKAQKLYDQGEYSKAYDTLHGVQTEEAIYLKHLCHYQIAQEYYQKGDYVFASSYFEDLGDFLDSKEMILACRYEIALQTMQYSQYERAMEIFTELGDYADSQEQILACYYGLGNQAISLNDFSNAHRYFILAGDYEDAMLKADEALYLQGNACFAKGQTAAAEKYFDQITVFPDYAAPHVATLEDARAFLRQRKEELAQTITCYISDMPDYVTRSTIDDVLYNYVPYMASTLRYDEYDKELYIEPVYYPSERILYAWRTGDTSVLSEEEAAVMAQALDLVAQAQASSEDPLEVERWLFDWLGENVDYETYNKDIPAEVFVQLRQPTCIGALVDGLANCQGYADAFYLLGTMAGFDVCKIGGEIYSGAHAWNGIMLDGKLYMVDATVNSDEATTSEEIDALYRYYFQFNVPYDPSRYAICGDPDIFPELVTENDRSKQYGGFTDLDTAVEYILRHYKDGTDNSASVVVYDQQVDRKTLQDSVWRITAKLGITGYSLTPVIQPYGSDTFITLKW